MTVRLFEGHQRDQYQSIFDAMFRGRAEMFSHRLQWDVTVTDGWEIDLYDDLEVMYLVCMSSAGKVLGSLRLMPTTGRTLMTEVFAAAFDEPVDIRSALVWEGTRFCVHTDPHPILTPTGVNLVTCELFMAMCEVSLAAGLTNIIAVYDSSLRRIYQRIGWTPHALGTSDAFPHGRIFAGLWNVSEDALSSMRLNSGINASVIDSDLTRLRRSGQ